jgi:DNA-binding NarL/FixJ family response regulator
LFGPYWSRYRDQMSGKRVLLVDDHAGFCASATALLATERLDVVAVAASGEEAIALVGRVQYDVVLLDLFLPGMDGVDVAWQLADPDRVILISSHDEAHADPRVASAPILGFISKRDLTCAAIRGLLA